MQMASSKILYSLASWQETVFKVYSAFPFRPFREEVLRYGQQNQPFQEVSFGALWSD